MAYVYDRNFYAIYYGCSGFFKIGGEVKSTLIMGFAKDEGDDLTVVIYHEGIKARVYMKKSKEKITETNDEISGGTKTDGKYKEWVIYDELPVYFPINAPRLVFEYKVNKKISLIMYSFVASLRIFIQ